MIAIRISTLVCLYFLISTDIKSLFKILGGGKIPSNTLQSVCEGSTGLLYYTCYYLRENYFFA